MIHFECIDNKHKLYSECPTDYELEKKVITFYLKCLGKEEDKRVNIDPLGAQRHKLSFVSYLSLHLMSYQLEHSSKL